MYWGWNGFGWSGMLLMMLLMLLFWGGLIALVVFGLWALIRSSQPGSRGSQDGSSRSLEILQERYARGEIAREQYEQMRRDLTV